MLIAKGIVCLFTHLLFLSIGYLLAIEFRRHQDQDQLMRQQDSPLRKVSAICHIMRISCLHHDTEDYKERDLREICFYICVSKNGTFIFSYICSSSIHPESSHVQDKRNFFPNTIKQEDYIQDGETVSPFCENEPVTSHSLKKDFSQLSTAVRHKVPLPFITSRNDLFRTYLKELYRPQKLPMDSEAFAQKRFKNDEVFEPLEEIRVLSYLCEYCGCLYYETVKKVCLEESYFDKSSHVDMNVFLKELKTRDDFNSIDELFSSDRIDIRKCSNQYKRKFRRHLKYGKFSEESIFKLSEIIFGDTIVENEKTGERGNLDYSSGYERISNKLRLCNRKKNNSIRRTVFSKRKHNEIQRSQEYSENTSALKHGNSMLPLRKRRQILHRTKKKSFQELIGIKNTEPSKNYLYDSLHFFESYLYLPVQTKGVNSSATDYLKRNSSELAIKKDPIQKYSSPLNYNLTQNILYNSSFTSDSSNSSIPSGLNKYSPHKNKFPNQTANSLTQNALLENNPNLSETTSLENIDVSTNRESGTDFDKFRSESGLRTTFPKEESDELESAISSGTHSVNSNPDYTKQSRSFKSSDDNDLESTLNTEFYSESRKHSTAVEENEERFKNPLNSVTSLSDFYSEKGKIEINGEELEKAKNSRTHSLNPNTENTINAKEVKRIDDKVEYSTKIGNDSNNTSSEESDHTTEVKVDGDELARTANSESYFINYNVKNSNFPTTAKENDGELKTNLNSVTDSFEFTSGNDVHSRINKKSDNDRKTDINSKNNFVGILTINPIASTESTTKSLSSSFPFDDFSEMDEVVSTKTDNKLSSKNAETPILKEENFPDFSTTNKFSTRHFLDQHYATKESYDISPLRTERDIHINANKVLNDMDEDDKKLEKETLTSDRISRSEDTSTLANSKFTFYDFLETSERIPGKTDYDLNTKGEVTSILQEDSLSDLRTTAKFPTDILPDQELATKESKESNDIFSARTERPAHFNTNDNLNLEEQERSSDISTAAKFSTDILPNQQLATKESKDTNDFSSIRPDHEAQFNTNYTLNLDGQEISNELSTAAKFPTDILPDQSLVTKESKESNEISSVRTEPDVQLNTNYALNLDRRESSNDLSTASEYPAAILPDQQLATKYSEDSNAISSLRTEHDVHLFTNDDLNLDGQVSTNDLSTAAKFPTDSLTEQSLATKKYKENNGISSVTIEHNVLFKTNYTLNVEGKENSVNVSTDAEFPTDTLPDQQLETKESKDSNGISSVRTERDVHFNTNDDLNLDKQDRFNDISTIAKFPTDILPDQPLATKESEDTNVFSSIRTERNVHVFTNDDLNLVGQISSNGISTEAQFQTDILPDQPLATKESKDSNDISSIRTEREEHFFTNDDLNSVRQVSSNGISTAAQFQTDILPNQPLATKQSEDTNVFSSIRTERDVHVFTNGDLNLVGQVSSNGINTEAQFQTDILPDQPLATKESKDSNEISSLRTEREEHFFTNDDLNSVGQASSNSISTTAQFQTDILPDQPLSTKESKDSNEISSVRTERDVQFNTNDNLNLDEQERSNDLSSKFPTDISPNQPLETKEYKDTYDISSTRTERDVQFNTNYALNLDGKDIFKNLSIAEKFPTDILPDLPLTTKESKDSNEISSLRTERDVNYFTNDDLNLNGHVSSNSLSTAAQFPTDIIPDQPLATKESKESNGISSVRTERDVQFNTNDNLDKQGRSNDLSTASKFPTDTLRHQELATKESKESYGISSVRTERDVHFNTNNALNLGVQKSSNDFSTTAKFPTYILPDQPLATKVSKDINEISSARTERDIHINTNNILNLDERDILASTNFMLPESSLQTELSKINYEKSTESKIKFSHDDKEIDKTIREDIEVLTEIRKAFSTEEFTSLISESYTGYSESNNPKLFTDENDISSRRGPEQQSENVDDFNGKVAEKKDFIPISSTKQSITNYEFDVKQDSTIYADQPEIPVDVVDKDYSETDFFLSSSLQPNDFLTDSVDKVVIKMTTLKTSGEPDMSNTHPLNIKPFSSTISSRSSTLQDSTVKLQATDQSKSSITTENLSEVTFDQKLTSYSEFVSNNEAKSEESASTSPSLNRDHVTEIRPISTITKTVTSNVDRIATSDIGISYPLTDQNSFTGLISTENFPKISTVKIIAITEGISTSEILKFDEYSSKAVTRIQNIDSAKENDITPALELASLTAIDDGFNNEKVAENHIGISTETEFSITSKIDLSFSAFSRESTESFNGINLEGKNKEILTPTELNTEFDSTILSVKEFGSHTDKIVPTLKSTTSLSNGNKISIKKENEVEERSLSETEVPVSTVLSANTMTLQKEEITSSLKYDLTAEIDEEESSSSRERDTPNDPPENKNLDFSSDENLIRTERDVLSSSDKDIPVLSSSDKDIPVLSSSDKDIPVLSSRDKDIPVLSSSDKDIPVLSSSDTEIPILNAETANTLTQNIGETNLDAEVSLSSVNYGLTPDDIGDKLIGAKNLTSTEENTVTYAEDDLLTSDKESLGGNTLKRQDETDYSKTELTQTEKIILPTNEEIKPELVSKVLEIEPEVTSADDVNGASFSENTRLSQVTETKGFVTELIPTGKEILPSKQDARTELEPRTPGIELETVSVEDTNDVSFDEIDQEEVTFPVTELIPIEREIPSSSFTTETKLESEISSTELKISSIDDTNEVSVDENERIDQEETITYPITELIRTAREIFSSSEDTDIDLDSEISVLKPEVASTDDTSDVSFDGNDMVDESEEATKPETELIRTEREVISSSEETELDSGVSGLKPETRSVNDIDDVTSDENDVMDRTKEITYPITELIRTEREINPPNLNTESEINPEISDFKPETSSEDGTGDLSFSGEVGVSINADISTELNSKTSSKDIPTDFDSDPKQSISSTDLPRYSTSKATATITIKPQTDIDVSTIAEKEINTFPQLFLSPTAPKSTDETSDDSETETPDDQKVSNSDRSLTPSSSTAKSSEKTSLSTSDTKAMDKISTSQMTSSSTSSTTRSSSTSSSALETTTTSSSKTNAGETTVLAKQQNPGETTSEAPMIPFHFTIDADFNEIVGKRKKEFEENLTNQLVVVMRLPFECLQNLEVSPGSIEVNFELMPSPDHGHMADEKALKAAADELKRLIDNGQLNIKDLDGNTLIVIPMDPPTKAPLVNNTEQTTIILGVVIGSFIFTVVAVAIAAIVIKRKNNVTQRLTPIEEMRSKLPSYREIPFQEALFMKGSEKNKLMKGKYCYNTGKWMGPGPEPVEFRPPDSAVYRPPTDSEIGQTPRPPTVVRERLKSDWELDWDSMVISR